MRKRILSCAAAAVIALATCVSGPAAMQDAPEYGPPKGTLVIVGGGSMDGTGIIERFIQLAGGPDAHFAASGALSLPNHRGAYRHSSAAAACWTVHRQQ
jgi:hypothetical protein